MKSIAVMEDGSLQKVEVPMPKMDSSSVLVKTLSCGVCSGTDGKIIHQAFKGIGKDCYPTLLGHEAVGRVVEVGKDVVRFKEGDLILLPYIEEPLGGFNSHWGAFSEYGICKDYLALAKNGIGPYTPDFKEWYWTQKTIPADFDPVYSSMIITLREVLAATRNFGFKSGESIVIFGAGPVGLTFCKFAKLLGMGPIISVDITDVKIPEAIHAGADYAFNSNKADIVSEIKKILPGGADYSLDAVGNNALINQGMELIRDNGKLLTYGISRKLDMNLDWSKAPYNWSLQFLQFPVKKQEGDAHEQIINWIREGVIDLKDYVSHIIDFERALDAFDMIEKRVPCKKIVIKY